jgi:uncharacterized low-complexity protein
MSKKNCIKPVAAAIGATLAGSLSVVGLANADENPFGASQLESGYMVLASKDEEGKCGDGKTMEEKAEKEGKCGEGKKMEGKCGEGKTMEEKPAKEGKCGEGKCGEGKSE